MLRSGLRAATARRTKLDTPSGDVARKSRPACSVVWALVMRCKLHLLFALDDFSASCVDFVCPCALDPLFQPFGSMLQACGAYCADQSYRRPRRGPVACDKIPPCWPTAERIYVVSRKRKCHSCGALVSVRSPESGGQALLRVVLQLRYRMFALGRIRCASQTARDVPA